MEQKKYIKHGQFKIINNKNQYIINPLSQYDISNNWQLVLPKRKNNSTIHHFSICLSQLHPQLWKYLSISHIDKNKYNIINWKIYQYTIKMTEYDNDIIKIYNLMNNIIYKNQVIRIYNYLEKQSIKGWIMIFIKNKYNL